MLPSLDSTTHTHAVFLGPDVRVTALSPALAAGQRNMLAVHPRTVAPAQCLAARTALVFQALSDKDRSTWLMALLAARRAAATAGVSGTAGTDLLGTGLPETQAPPGEGTGEGAAEGGTRSAGERTEEDDAPVFELTARMHKWVIDIYGPRSVACCDVVSHCVEATTAGGGGAAAADEDRWEGPWGVEVPVVSLAAVGLAADVRIGDKSLRAGAGLRMVWMEDRIMGASGCPDMRYLLSSHPVSVLEGTMGKVDKERERAQEAANATQASRNRQSIVPVLSAWCTKQRARLRVCGGS